MNDTYQSLGQGVFPKQEDYEPDYQSMWQDFVDEIKKIPAASDDDTSRNAFVNSLLAVLKKHTSSVPASTFRTDLPAASLYDHLRLTATIADCLHVYAQENRSEERRVGKECRARWSPEHRKKQNRNRR